MPSQQLSNRFLKRHIPLPQGLSYLFYYALFTKKSRDQFIRLQFTQPYYGVIEWMEIYMDRDGQRGIDRQYSAYSHGLDFKASVFFY